MNDRIHRYLDGELPAEVLTPEELAEAREWSDFLARVREGLPGRAPAGLAARIASSLEGERPHGAGSVGSLWDWLVRPRPVRVSPLGAAAAAGALAALVLWPGPLQRPEGSGISGNAPAVETTAPTRVYVEFVLRAPDASSVSVAGSFNEWTPALLVDADGDGVWSGRVSIEPGVHQYMFVLDGSTWVTDPNAERYVDDGFGQRNAVLAVAAGT